MTDFLPRARSVLCLAMVLSILLPPGASSAESTQDRLRKEKARLTEMRKKAEKTAAELNEALRRERSARHKVDDLQKRLTRQRRLIARIDGKLSALAREMEKAESEMRRIDEAREGTERGLERAAALAFLEERQTSGLFPLEPHGERLRYFTNRLLASESGKYSRLSADKEEKENALSGIERQVQLSEKRISREKKVGESLLSQRKKEAQRLAQIRTQKERKEKELKALRARLARMEALVSRIERQAREAERRRPRGREGGPSRFSGVPGGLVAPVRGKVVGPFGKYRDPVFDVEVENHGVEIEASSGSPIRAIGRGNVVFSGTVSGFGKVLIIQHGTGLFSVYGKAESFTVAQGQVVAPGQNIGRLPESSDGKSVLYLELRAAGTAIDPTAVVPLSR
ncbi:MAG TPA: peptidoglycan DD-metalloendopeptidase family protein [Candidatus Deferrimicrobiaceae bacterium]|nr:peptidoglycan DD-metalloendopeptidase family protein [Candidatus Deferrimicrobiaceae bacterium]